MRKLFSYLIILGIYLLFCGFTYGADCSSLANQISQIKASIQEVQEAADGYTAFTTNTMSSRGLGMSAIASQNAANPYTQRVEELKEILVLAEQDYNTCINNRKTEVEQQLRKVELEVINSFIEGFDEGEKYFKLGLNYLNENDAKSARTNFINALKIYESLLNGYSNYSNIRKVVDGRYDIKPLLSDSFTSIGANLCLMGVKEKGVQSLKHAIDLNNKDAKELYDICNSLTEMEAQDLWCSVRYGENIHGYKYTEGENAGKLDCQCDAGYKINDERTKCIEKQGISETSNLNNMTNKATTDYLPKNTSIVNNGYSQEYNDAYEFAYANRITTMPTIEQANMHGEIIRAEIAKMLANWVKTLGYLPDTSKSCKFNDISSVKGDLYTAIMESCQLGIMGQGISNFRPYDKITKGEVSTAISRILRGSLYEGGDPYYAPHMNALKSVGVLDVINNPNTNELRGNVMTMLMRASNNALNKTSKDELETLEEMLNSSEDVVVYNDAIVNLIVKCGEKSDSLEEMYETATVEQLKVANDDIINTCTSVVESLKNLGDREKDSSFKDVSIKYVAYVITYYKEFKKKIPYLERELTTIEEKELNSINAKLDEIWTKKENVSEEVSIAQEKFAEKFGYTLE